MDFRKFRKKRDERWRRYLIAEGMVMGVKVRENLKTKGKKNTTDSKIKGSRHRRPKGRANKS